MMETKVNRREFLKVSAAGAILSMAPNIILAQEQKPIELLKSQPGSGSPIMQLLWKRMSTKEFSPEPLSPELLSNLLWAAFGINRPDGKRTAATGGNRQEIDIYVAMASGLYLYDPKASLLNPVLAQDIRAATGNQEYVKIAAVTLIYVADYAKMAKGPDEAKILSSSIATGLISENVYLYCASVGLGAVVRGSVDRQAVASLMKLRPDQKIVLTQTVGYPKKA